ncbi:hypothetical protein H6P81_015141 [Aristolochia fimbriata]|uniref:Stigma-specific Stig1 family protein n=1 Tax=Aristolochia fimbriata TaxID=158543 RepID=A0AAV7E7J1_ARIFI|nr:hypothetical protein H6P81_015141 [Aristolochia fimbriata]
MQRPPQRHLWCGGDPDVCLDPDKNPWAGATVCCGRRFCRDTSTDPNNCGGCGVVCGYGLLCCGGRCVNSSNDRQHCGSCNSECPGQQRCAFGMCDYAS